MIFFAETTINIASLCITCNGSIAVQSLKTRTVCKMKVNYVTKKTVFPCLKITTSFEFLTLKNLTTSSTKVFKLKYITIFLLNIVCESSQTLNKIPLPPETIFIYFR